MLRFIAVLVHDVSSCFFLQTLLPLRSPLFPYTTLFRSCLAGENGCGKSTLIKVISGVYQQDSGYIEFAGKRFGKITPRDAIASGIQVIYQDFSIFPNLTVMENLAFNTELADGHKFVNRKRMRKIAEEAIAKINFDVELDRLVGTLSVAEK